MRNTWNAKWALAGGAALTTAIFAVVPQAKATDSFSVSELAHHTHIHGLAVDRKDPAYLLIATHHGLFRAGPDGKAVRISVVQDFMGFNAHPSDPNTLFASGHPAQGGNLGFITSADQGKTWTHISPGVNGPVDFHQMTVSAADPCTIYGAYRGIQISRDGGKTWKLVGPEPEKLIALGASAKSADTVYAAAEAGLLVSKDAGKTWNALLKGTPATFVEVTPDSIIYTFLVGRGLLRSPEEPLKFTDLGNDFGAGFLLHFAIDPRDPNRLFAATSRGRVLMSNDQGRTWNSFGSPKS